MNRHQLRQTLEAKLEYNRNAVNKGKVKADRKDRMLKESMAINAMLKDLNNGLDFVIVDGFISTVSAKVKY